MKIAISGGASQGKSTLVDVLRRELVFKDYKFETNLTRDLSCKGIPINESGTALTQLHVMLKHYERLVVGGENVILDRCALDGLAYSKYFFNIIEKQIQNALVLLFENMITQYDYIFYIVPELALVNDGQRSTDVEFFTTVNEHFESVISTYKVPVIRIRGTVEERIQIIKERTGLQAN
jgi:nicotinamide riboside kinase